MTTELTIADFLRRVIVAENPKQITINLVRGGEAPTSAITTFKIFVFQLLLILEQNADWSSKISAVKALVEEWPQEFYAPVIEALSAQERLAQAKALVFEIKVLKSQNLQSEAEAKIAEFGKRFPDFLAKAKAQAKAKVKMIDVSSADSSINIEQALQQFSAQRDNRREERKKERTKEILLGRIQQLSAKQLLELLRRNSEFIPITPYGELDMLSVQQLINLVAGYPELFILSEEFDIDNGETVIGEAISSFTLSDYLIGWRLGLKNDSEDAEAMRIVKCEILDIISQCVEDFTSEERLVLWREIKNLITYQTIHAVVFQSWHNESSSGDREITKALKAEVVEVIESFVQKLSNDQSEVLWQSVRELSRLMMRSGRGRRRQSSGDAEAKTPQSEELLGHFEEAATKLSAKDQEFLNSLKREERMLALAGIFRQVGQSNKLQHELKLVGNLVLDWDALRAFEELAKADLFKRRLAEERARHEGWVLGMWKQIKALRSQLGETETEEVVFNILADIKAIHDDYKKLPMTIRREVYGEEKSEGPRVYAKKPEKKAVEAFANFGDIAFFLAMFPTEERSAKKLKNKKAKKVKISSTSSPKKEKKIGEKKYPDLGSPVSVRPVNLMEINLTPRNQGANHRKRPMMMAQSGYAVA